jgi:hypothetical protein
MFHKEYDRIGSIAKGKTLVVSLKKFIAKTN